MKINFGKVLRNNSLFLPLKRSPVKQDCQNCFCALGHGDLDTDKSDFLALLSIPSKRSESDFLCLHLFRSY
jgi:hypothetical protein